MFVTLAGKENMVSQSIIPSKMSKEKHRIGLKLLPRWTNVFHGQCLPGSWTVNISVQVLQLLIHGEVRADLNTSEMCKYTGLDIYVTDSSQEQHVRSFNKGIINTISQ